MTRSIAISPCLNGYTVSIGCQLAVFTSPAELGAAVTEYYKDPEGTEKKYLAAAVNKSNVLAEPVGLGQRPMTACEAAQPPTTRYPDEPVGLRDPLARNGI